MHIANLPEGRTMQCTGWHSCHATHSSRVSRDPQHKQSQTGEPNHVPDEMARPSCLSIAGLGFNYRPCQKGTAHGHVLSYSADSQDATTADRF